MPVMLFLLTIHGEVVIKWENLLALTAKETILLVFPASLFFSFSGDLCNSIDLMSGTLIHRGLMVGSL